VLLFFFLLLFGVQDDLLFYEISRNTFLHPDEQNATNFSIDGDAVGSFNDAS
jgi:hypothetical protein